MPRMTVAHLKKTLTSTFVNVVVSLKCGKNLTMQDDYPVGVYSLRTWDRILVEFQGENNGKGKGKGNIEALTER